MEVRGGGGEVNPNREVRHDYSFTVSVRASKLITHKCISAFNPESLHEVLGAPGGLP